MKALTLLRIRAHTLSSPPGLVAVIGAENAGRAPANPRMDGAAYARASPFHTNYLPRRKLCQESNAVAQAGSRYPAGRRARPPGSQSPPSRDSFSYDEVAGLG